VDDVLKYLLAVILLSIAAALLPKLKAPLKKLTKAYIKFRVSRCVKKAEKMFSGPKTGTKKKAWVLTCTKKYNAQLVKMDETIDDVIEQAVAILKARSASSQTSLKSAASDLVDESIENASETVKNKLSENSKKEDK
jgi:hypothetical protein